MIRRSKAKGSHTDGFAFVLVQKAEHHQCEDKERDEADDTACDDPQHWHLHPRLQEFWEME